MRYMLSLLLVLSLCTSAGAQIRTLFVETKECPLNLMCRKEFGYATCFAVAYSPSKNEYVYLTAGHNLKGSSGKATVTKVEVGGTRARVIAGWVKTGVVDFAIVASSVPATLRRLSERAPAVGEKVLLAGYDYAGSRTRPTMRRMLSDVVQTDPGKFCITSVSTTTGMSGGPAVNEAGDCVGMVIYDSAILGNWPGIRGFRESVRHYFPDAEFAVETAPPPPVTGLVAANGPAGIKKNPIKETTRQMSAAEISLAAKLKTATSELAKVRTDLAAKDVTAPAGPKADSSGASKIIKAVVKAAPVVAEVAAGGGASAAVGAAGGVGMFALLGPYAIPAFAAWTIGREVVPRGAAWRRRKKKSTNEWSPDSVDLAPVTSDTASLKRQLARAESKLAAPPQYIDVPVDHWNRAYAWAKRQMANDKFLDVKDHYFLQESLIKQYLTAMKTR